MKEKVVVQRDPWLDNIKGILVILVVIGHMTASMVQSSYTIEIIYKLINCFHMPCFMFLTGYTSKRRIREKDYGNVITRLLIPYLIVQFMLCAFCGLYPNAMEQLPGQSAARFTWLIPGYHLWYLFAMVVFCFVAPSLVEKFEKRPWLLLTLAFLCSILIGYGSEVIYLRITKNIAYFPLFLTGYYFRKEWLYQLRDKISLKIAAAGVIALWLFLMIRYNDRVYVNIFAMSKSYITYPESFNGFYPVIARCVYLFGALIVGWAFMSLVTKRKTIFTRVGQYSLYVYILHGFCVIVLRTFSKYTFPVFPNINTPQEKIIYLLGGVVLSFILASPPVVRIFRPAFEPRIRLDKIKEILR